MKNLFQLLLLGFFFWGCSRDFHEADSAKPSSGREAIGKAAGLSSASVLIDNDTVWTDTDGNEILAQGGGITKVSDTYHWFGPKFGNTGNYSFYGINHYTSSDLKHWAKQSPAIVPGSAGIPFKTTSWVGRPFVIWNPNTNQFVMVIEWGGNETGVRNQYAFLTAASIDGPWTYQSTKLIKRLPDINNTLYALGDLGVYVEGSSAWLLYTFDKPQANYSQAILQLDTDFMTPLPPTPGNYTEFSGGTWKAGVQEAAGIFKRGSTYYYFTSLCNGWKSSETRYRTATSMSGPWSSNAIVPTNPASDNSFNTQHDFVLPIVGSATTTYMYCGDRWSNFTGVGKGRYAWFPLTFDSSGIPSIQGGDWEIDLTTGEWRKPALVQLQNPGFESDLAHWSITGNASIATAAAEVHTGVKAIKSWSTNAYTSTIKNSSALNCPAGNYTARVWSRGGGTFNARVFQVFVNGTKVREISLPVSTSWTAFAINTIPVPAGASVTLGVALNANARAWTQFDDFALIAE